MSFAPGPTKGSTVIEFAYRYDGSGPEGQGETTIPGATYQFDISASDAPQYVSFIGSTGFIRVSGASTAVTIMASLYFDGVFQSRMVRTENLFSNVAGTVTAPIIVSTDFFEIIPPPSGTRSVRIDWSFIPVGTGVIAAGFTDVSYYRWTADAPIDL